MELPSFEDVLQNNDVLLSNQHLDHDNDYDEKADAGSPAEAQAAAQAAEAQAAAQAAEAQAAAQAAEAQAAAHAAQAVPKEKKQPRQRITSYDAWAWGANGGWSYDTAIATRRRLQ